MNRVRSLGIALVVLSGLTLFVAPIAVGKKAHHAQKSTKPINGEGVFKQNCAQCHPGGGNTVKPSKPLAGSEKLSSLPVFKAYLQSPVGHMPYYKHIVTDEATLKALYDYVKKLPKPEQT